MLADFGKWPKYFYETKTWPAWPQEPFVKVFTKPRIPKKKLNPEETLPQQT
jgi:hypothetical protein